MLQFLNWKKVQNQTTLQKDHTKKFKNKKNYILDLKIEKHVLLMMLKKRTFTQKNFPEFFESGNLYGASLLSSFSIKTIVTILMEVFFISFFLFSQLFLFLRTAT
jgi:hypothetical protein